MTVIDSLKLKKLCTMFIEELEKMDMLDHPKVFETLDDVARERKFMIHCEQRGIYGTRLFFGRDVER